MGARLQTLEAEIHQHAGRVFSVSSRDQLEAVLYDELQLSDGPQDQADRQALYGRGRPGTVRDEHPIIAGPARIP